MRRSFNLDTAQQIEFGTYLRSLRENVNKTQSEVANAADISIGYVSTLESGTRNPPTLHVLEKLAAVYEVEPEKLKAAAGYFNEDKLQGLDRERVDWAFSAACRDPEFEFGERNLYKPMALETKAFIIELYERCTGRKLLTAQEEQKMKENDEQ